MAYVRFDTDDWTSHHRIPTEEDTLEVNFWSIVSDLRAIIGGTLGPRSWDDISSTWKGHGADQVKMRAPDKSHIVRERINRSNRERQLATVLLKHGMASDEAWRVAHELINKEK